MFDSVLVRCRTCGEQVEFQSKAGECGLAEYSLDDCPPEIAADILGDSESCRKCGGTVTIRGKVIAILHAE
jgi:hypothetical protein